MPVGGVNTWSPNTCSERPEATERMTYQVSQPCRVYNAEIHLKVLHVCLGNQQADLVMQLCAQLKWPDPNAPIPLSQRGHHLA